MNFLDEYLDQGITPVLTWEPRYTADEGKPQPSFALERFLEGDHDEQIRHWAERFAEWGRDVVLRFGHEMNIDSFPWGAGVEGNTAAQYVAVWRRVHNAFSVAGADNVQWCWAPNVPLPRGWEDTDEGLAAFFPGEDVVDLLGIDGYNWGPHAPWGWTEPVELFDSALAQLRALGTGLPLVVTEVGTVEGEEPGQSKAEWITRLYDYMQTQPDVRAVMWFQFKYEDEGIDWRVDSSPQALQAYRRAISGLH